MNKWYVIQVFTGKEDEAKDLIEQSISHECLNECFVPRYRNMKKFKGEWRACTAVLFPGYLIAVTSEIEKLERELHSVPALTKILGSNESFFPLNAEEKAWIDAFTQRDHRIIEMSTGVIEGDRVIIKEGPLINHTAWIKSINRRKRLAYLEMQICGRTVEAKVGLGIISKS